MDLQLLGPVEATLDGHPVPLGAPKQRALLAMLALHVNATVSVDRLVDGLWGEEPPVTAPKMVQLYVSQLRRLLAGGDAQIVTRGRGYELRVREDAVDAVRFERLVEEADRDGAIPNGAAREALALWRGVALADVAGEPFAATEIRRLEALWLRATELALDADLAAGRFQEVLVQLERLIDEHPLRERLHAQRMLALYRSGRQAEALAAYVAARRRLVDAAGVEPGAELREMHERMLGQDPSLQLAHLPIQANRTEHVPAGRVPVPAAVGARPLTRALPIRRLLLGAAATLVAALAVFALTRLIGADRLPGIDEGAVGVIDPEAAAIRAQHQIGRESRAVALGAGSVWAANPSEGTVSRIHREGDRVETIDVGPAPAALAFGAGSLWVAGGEDGALVQVDPATNRVQQRIPVGNGLSAVAVAHGAVWAATALDGEVVRIDLRSGRVTRRIAVGGRPAALATGPGAVWVAGEESGTISRIDPRSNQIVETIQVGNGPSALVVGLGGVWSANRQDGTVSRIDPVASRVTDTLPAGSAPAALAIAGGALWVADATGAVRRLDPHTRRITRTVHTGASPAGLVAVDGALWATAVAPPGAHRGGTLRVGSPPIDLDPAFGGYDPNAGPVNTLVYEGLLAHRRAGGAAGGRLVGALAVAVPTAADRGLRYVFRLRPGLRYSDGTPVRARDFRLSMERALAAQGPKLGMIFDTIDGAARCRTTPRRCDLSRGIVTDDWAGTVTIRLRRPDPNLLGELALTVAAVVPPSTPHRRLEPAVPAGTGPYRVARLVPGRGALLTRNPYFRPRGPGGRPAGFADRIQVTMGEESGRIAAAEQGRLDIVSSFATITGEKLTALRTRIGSRLQSGSYAMTAFAWLNVKAAPFDDPRVRRAVNLAVDRGRAVDLTGGPDAGSPTCQLLPPGLPGRRPICPFTLAPSPAGAWTAPDRAEAERLVAASGARGTTVELWTFPYARTVGRHLVETLRDLGFRSRMRVFDDVGEIYAAAADPRLRPQIGLTGWIADSAEPAGYLRPLVSCAAYTPGDPASTNLSHFCDRRIDAAIDRAQAAGPAAGAAWQRIERRIAESSPIVSLVNPRWVVVTSSRAGNVQFHPLIGTLLDQVWVR